MTKSRFNGGVLVIGSLAWDTNREAWRGENLDTTNAIANVQAPIRYGRLSNGRQTYTMVFSSECLVPERLGKAIFYPFRSNPVDVKALDRQAVELIKAERNKESLTSSAYAWNFGALAILLNPKTSQVKPKETNLLKSWWNSKYNGLLNNQEFKVHNEAPIIDVDGHFNFNWPEKLNDFDFLIATGIKPELTSYPNSQQVAQKIMANGLQDDYFRNNIAKGISTFEDAEIKRELKSLELK